MNEIPLTVVGTVVRDISFNTTKSGANLASFRIACNNRRWNRLTNAWEDGDTTFLNVTCWRTLAQNVLASVRKGDPVVVTGRLKVREWSTEERNGISVDLEASAIGHDLSRGRAAFERIKRSVDTAEVAGPEASPASAVLREAAAAAGVNHELLDRDLLEREAVPQEEPRSAAGAA